jgi:hypothetical protein
MSVTPTVVHDTVRRRTAVDGPFEAPDTPLPHNASETIHRLATSRSYVAE